MSPQPDPVRSSFPPRVTSHGISAYRAADGPTRAYQELIIPTQSAMPETQPILALPPTQATQAVMRHSIKRTEAKARAKLSTRTAPGTLASQLKYLHRFLSLHSHAPVALPFSIPLTL